MEKEIIAEELNLALNQGNFIRAAGLGKELNLDPGKLKELELKALWEMAAINRNPTGTKQLAEEYGISPSELKEFLKTQAEQLKKEGKDRALRPQYDYHTGKYLDFSEWLECLFKKWKS